MRANKERIRDIGKLITYLKPRNFNSHTEEALQADILWGSSYFWANVIYSSKESRNNILFNELEVLKGRYEQLSNEQVDLDYILGKGWIRPVLGYVQIPKVVKSACRQAKKLDDIPKGKEEKYSNIIKYKKELLFINFIYEIKYCENNHYFFISKFRFNKLLEDHKKLFPATPNFNYLKINDIVNSHNSNSYKIRPNLNVKHGECLFDKIFILLWNKTLNQKKFSTDEERLLFVISKTHPIKGWIEKLQPCSEGNSNNRLLNAAKNLILNEKDIYLNNEEISKIRSEDREGEWINFENSNLIKIPPLTQEGDLFELYESLNILNKVVHSDMLYHQSSRSTIGFLINLIVKNEEDNSFERQGYNRIRTLFSESGNRPFLLWELSTIIKEQRNELLPELLINPKTTSLGLRLLLDKIWKNSNRRAEIPNLYCALAKEYVSIIFEGLKSNENWNENAKIIFQCLLTASKNKFYISDHDQDESKVYEVIKKEIQVAFIIENVSPQSNFWNNAFLKVQQHLLNYILNYDYDKSRTNDLISLPFIKLDLLLWLYECIEKHQQPGDKSVNLKSISNCLLKTYLEVINTKVLESKFVTEDLLNAPLTQPVFIARKRQIEEFPWEKLCLILFQNNKFIDFLKPVELTFIPASHKYDNYNRYTTEKLRTHIFILLKIHHYLSLSQYKLNYFGDKLQNLFPYIEGTIQDYICENCQSIPEQGKVDLFDEYFERQIYSNDSIELLPIISKTVNQFKDLIKAEYIIESITKSDELIKSLKLLEYIISERLRIFLVKQIEKIDIENVLDDIPHTDLQPILSSISSHEIFIEKSKVILEKWESILSKSSYFKKEHSIFCFKIKLLLAYLENDKNKINIAEPPKLDSYRISLDYTFNPIDDKQFYIALWHLKNNEPENAWGIFNQLLVTSNDDRPSIALNRFASKIRWAETEPNLTFKLSLYKKSLQEWDEFEINLKDKKQIFIIQDHIIHNKLRIYNELSNYIEFDKIFNDLDVAGNCKKIF